MRWGVKEATAALVMAWRRGARRRRWRCPQIRATSANRRVAGGGGRGNWQCRLVTAAEGMAAASGRLLAALAAEGDEAAAALAVATISGGVALRVTTQRVAATLAWL